MSNFLYPFFNQFKKDAIYSYKMFKKHKLYRNIFIDLYILLHLAALFCIFYTLIMVIMQYDFLSALFLGISLSSLSVLNLPNLFLIIDAYTPAPPPSQEELIYAHEQERKEKLERAKSLLPSKRLPVNRN